MAKKSDVEMGISKLEFKLLMYNVVLGSSSSSTNVNSLDFRVKQYIIKLD